MANIFRPLFITKAPGVAQPFSFFEILGFIVLFITPFATFYSTQNVGLAQDQRLFLSILSSTVVMWMFRLFPDFVSGIFLLLMTLVLGVAPAKVVLAGLSSETFVMIMSLGALAVIITESHLISRLLLNLIKRLPQSNFTYHFLIFFLGILLTPIIPSLVSRAQLMGPFLTRIFQALGIKEQNKNSTFLAFTAFVGIAAFASVFLSSSLMNFVVLGFLPVQDQFEFQWIGWFRGALAYGGIVFALCCPMMILLALFAPKLRLSDTYVHDASKVLGAISGKERMAIFCTVLFSVGVLTFSIHKISIAWISFAILFIILGAGLLEKRDFETKIDWAFLVFLSSAIGITSCFKFLNLDTFSTKMLVSYIGYFLADEYRFYIFIALLTIILRFILPIPAAVVLLSSVLIPLATNYGFSTWIVAFSILVSADAWFLPYQNLFYIAYEEGLSKENGGILPYRRVAFLTLNIFSVLVRLLALSGSFPYWKSIGLILRGGVCLCAASFLDFLHWFFISLAFISVQSVLVS